MKKLSRREILKLMGSAGALTMVPGMTLSQSVLAAEQYPEDLILTLNVFGAWDVTSLCDPKLNTNGEPAINNWAQGVSEIPKAGNIPFAPIGDNDFTFNKYTQDMLIINGIDAQTNAHTAGQIHAFSGRPNTGFPTITASVAGVYGKSLALTYINNGGYAGNGGLVTTSSMSGPDLIPKLANYDEIFHNVGSQHNSVLYPQTISERIKSAKLARIERQLAQTNLLTRHKEALNQFHLATKNLDELKKFNDFMPSELINDNDDLGYHPAWRQAEVAMISFKAGLTIGADLTQGDNFDTHANHDVLHQKSMRGLTRDIDTIWQLAEKYGISDKVTLIVNSEFSRTPYYNDEGGKDHWPLGSMIIMKKGVNWTNRVVGRTDEIQNGVKINPTTLQIDEANGALIYPKDVFQALRRQFGIADHSLMEQFDLKVEHEFDFFNPSLATPQLFS
jgi:hypothetical protein